MTSSAQRVASITAAAARSASSMPRTPACSTRSIEPPPVSLNLGGSVHDPNDAVGRLLFNVLAMVAELESDLIGLRTRDGMTVAKAKGHLRGKQPELNRRQEAHLVALVDSGGYSTAQVTELFSVGRSTVYRAIDRQRSSAPSATALTATAT